eukprot:evm.model.NODE_9949_length_46820_cov_28.931910.4
MLHGPCPSSSPCCASSSFITAVATAAAWALIILVLSEEVEGDEDCIEEEEDGEDGKGPAEKDGDEEKSSKTFEVFALMGVGGDEGEAAGEWEEEEEEEETGRDQSATPLHDKTRSYTSRGLSGSVRHENMTLLLLLLLLCCSRHPAKHLAVALFRGKGPTSWKTDKGLSLPPPPPPPPLQLCKEARKQIRAPTSSAEG